MKLPNTIFTPDQDSKAPFMDALKVLIDKDLPIEITYDLLTIVKKIDEKAAVFEEARMALVKKHGKEKDGQLEVPKKNIQAFSDDYTKLAAIEEEYDIEPLELDMAVLKENNVVIKPKTLLLLDKIIKLKK